MSTTAMAGLQPGFSGGRFNAAQSALVPFPNRYDAKLTYGVNVALGTSGSSILATKYRLALNGLYDPDVSGTGHQPYFWDTVTAIYTKYIATVAHVDITFNSPNITGLWVGWSIHTNTTSNDDPAGKELSTLMERPNFACVPISTSGTEMVTCRVSVPLHEVFGISRAQYLALPDVYGAAFSANPLSLAYLDLFLVDPNAAVIVALVRAVGRITYDVQFFDYASPPVS